MTKVRVILFILSILAVSLGVAVIEGQWHGVPEARGAKLSLVVHVNDDDTGLSATVDYPDQDAYGIVADDETFKDGTLEFSIGGIMASCKE